VSILIGLSIESFVLDLKDVFTNKRKRLNESN